MDVTNWTQKQLAERCLTDREQIEKLVRIAATESAEATPEYLDGPQTKTTRLTGCNESPGR